MVSPESYLDSSGSKSEKNGEESRDVSYCLLTASENVQKGALGIKRTVRRTDVSVK